MATIRKRSWTTCAGGQKAAWCVDYRDASGARRAKQFARKKDADAWLTQAAWEVLRGVHTPDSESITVAEAADLWIAKAEAAGRERGTVKQYRELASLHIKPLLGAERLSRLSMPKVEAFADALQQTRSKAMASKAVRALSSILTEAMRRGLVAQNVARGVKVARSSRDRKRIVIPERDELRKLLKASDLPAQPQMRSLMLVAALAGLRSSELRGLSWGHVDLKAGSITVAQRADAWGKIGAPKSEAGLRTIPIGPALISELRAWKLRCPPSPLDLVFPNEQGRPIWQSKLHKLYLSVENTAGLGAKAGARFGLHCLRHAAASAWIRQGLDLKRLQVWMGHSNIQITLDTYGHLLTDTKGDAALAGSVEAALLA